MTEFYRSAQNLEQSEALRSSIKKPSIRCCLSVQPDSMSVHLEVGKVHKGGDEAAPHVQVRALLQHQLLQVVVHKPKKVGHAIPAQQTPKIMTSRLAALNTGLVCRQQL